MADETPLQGFTSFGPIIIGCVAIVGAFWTIQQLSNNFVTIREHNEFQNRMQTEIQRLDLEVAATQAEREQYVTHPEAQIATNVAVEREEELQRQINSLNADLKTLQGQILSPNASHK
jgi:hypothetical protein